MTADKSEKASLKQKAKHELREFAVIFVYLAFFFCAVVTYGVLLLRQYSIPYYNYTTALINALVIAKVIMIGEYAHLGRKHESKPVLQSAMYKAVLFGGLVFGFHVVEEVIKRLVHGETLMGASSEIRIDELLARSVIVFCAFVPLFAFRELRRILGEEYFRTLLFETGGQP